MFFSPSFSSFFFFNDTATTEIYTLSLHDALPISSTTLLLGSVRLGRRRRVSDSIEGTMSLDLQTREKIYSRVCDLVTRKHFDPGMNGANWEELSKTSKDRILQSNSDEEFEKQIQQLLNE